VTWISDSAIERLRGLGDDPAPAHERYRVIEELGRGGMGVVYLAEDRVLGRSVALKVLRRQDTDGRARERLGREAHILARLEHPGIVPVHDVGALPDGRVFYTMKYVRGERLDRFVTSARTRAERLRLFTRICEAVAFAHAAGVVHRDLKPENVMVGPYGEVLVMDWGVAKVLGDAPETAAFAPVPSAPTGGAERTGGTTTGTVLGTPLYMAPEQRLGDPRRVDRRADLYALGGVLHFLLTGSPPPGTASAPTAAPVPRALEAIRLKAMAHDPALRYPGAEALAADVSRFLDGEPVSAHRETPWERIGRWIVRYRVPLLLVAAYLVMRALLLAFFGR
jgi:serine/threonine protein kinase